MNTAFCPKPCQKQTHKLALGALHCWRSLFALLAASYLCWKWSKPHSLGSLSEPIFAQNLARTSRRLSNHIPDPIAPTVMHTRVTSSQSTSDRRQVAARTKHMPRHTSTFQLIDFVHFSTPNLSHTSTSRIAVDCTYAWVACPTGSAVYICLCFNMLRNDTGLCGRLKQPTWHLV